MAGKIIDLNTAKRPLNAKNTIRKVFSQVDCLTCGICCKSATKLAIMDHEPTLPYIREIAESQFPEKIEEDSYGGFNIVSENGCPLLADSGDGKECSIYRFRPIICTAFPFVPMEVGAMDKGTGEITTTVRTFLTTACPPLKELAELGIPYVTSDDLVSLEGDEVKMQVPILSSTFLRILELRSHGLISPDTFVKGKSGPIFPIA